MRGIVYSLVFMTCVAVVAALLLLSFNGCGESPGVECVHSDAPNGYSCSAPGGGAEELPPYRAGQFPN